MRSVARRWTWADSRRLESGISRSTMQRSGRRADFHAGIAQATSATSTRLAATPISVSGSRTGTSKMSVASTRLTASAPPTAPSRRDVAARGHRTAGVYARAWPSAVDSPRGGTRLDRPVAIHPAKQCREQQLERNYARSLRLSLLKTPFSLRLSTLWPNGGHAATK